MEKLQRAYQLAVKTLDETIKSKYPYNYTEIPVRSDSRGEPVEYWLWRHHNAQCKAYRHNSGAIIAIGITYGDIGKGWFEYLNGILAIPRKVPHWKEPHHFVKASFEDDYKGKDKDINELYETQIMPKLIQMAPAIMQLEEKTFEKIIKGAGFESDDFGPQSSNWLTSVKNLDFKSLDKVVQEIEHIPKIVNEYNFWIHII